MELLYVYIDSYRGLKNKEFNFGRDVRFSYNKDANTICEIPFENALPKNFWGERISNLTMIVGNNGTGKTSLINCIIDFIKHILSHQHDVDGQGAVVLNDNGNYYLYVVKGKKSQFAVSLIRLDKNEEINDCSEINVELLKTKLVFLTNTLNRSDFERGQHTYDRRYNFLYDCSLGSWITTDVKSDVNHEYRNRDNQIGLSTYFFYETYRQVKYVFDVKQYEILEKLRDRKYAVPLPKRLYINVSFQHGIEKFPKDYESKDCFDEKNLIRAYNEKYARTNDINPSIDILINLLKYHLYCGCVYSLLNSIFRNMISRQADYFAKSFEKLINETTQDKPMHEGFVLIVDKIANALKCVITDIEPSKNNYGDQELESLYSSKEFYTKFIKFISSSDTHMTNLFRFEKEDGYNDISSFRIYIDSDNWLEEKAKSEWFMEFLQKYRYICNPDYFLDFYWDLSSGENNLLNLFSSLYYIYDRDYSSGRYGEYKIFNKISNQQQMIECNSIILLIDEADLTYHPEWQRQFVSLLLIFLPEVYPSINNIQIILSTHSPIILSDIPKTNVEFLSQKFPEMKTFGQNIYTLFKDSFILEHTIGEFADKKIKEVNAYLDSLINEKSCINENRNAISSLHDAKLVISMIGEDIIRKSLLSKYNRIISADISKELPIVKQYELLDKEDQRIFIQYIIDSQGDENN